MITKSILLAVFYMVGSIPKANAISMFQPTSSKATIYTQGNSLKKLESDLLRVQDSNTNATTFLFFNLNWLEKDDSTPELELLLNIDKVNTPGSLNISLVPLNDVKDLVNTSITSINLSRISWSNEILSRYLVHSLYIDEKNHKSLTIPLVETEKYLVSGEVFAIFLSSDDGLHLTFQDTANTLVSTHAPLLRIIYSKEMIKGDEGEQGPIGPRGPQGATGSQGAKGEKGEQGIAGPQGVPGAKGDKGDKGDKGEQGATGSQGAKGDKGEQGTAGPQGIPGAKGDKGEQGIPGIKGDRGEQGTPGIPGITGPQGLQGLQGERGVLSSIVAPMNGDNCLKSNEGQLVYDAGRFYGCGCSGSIFLPSCKWKVLDN